MVWRPQAQSLAVTSAFLHRAAGKLYTGEPIAQEVEILRRLQLRASATDGDLSLRATEQRGRGVSSPVVVENVPPFQCPIASGPPIEISAPPEPARQAELDADNAILLTPEIKVQAAALGNGTARIYAFFYNSVAVLWSRRAGAVDQATLLTRLLGAARVPSRYVFGTVRMPANRGIGTDLETGHPMRVQSIGVPNAQNTGVADAGGRGH